MQIICPHCTTSYAVDPAKFGVGGRKVRCARCHEVWIAHPQEMALAHDEDGFRNAAAEAGTAQDAAEAAAATPYVESPPLAGGDTNPAPGTGTWPALAREDAAVDPPAAKRRLRLSLGRPVIPSLVPPRLARALAVLDLRMACVAMAAMVAALLIWRADVVRLMPQTGAFFRMIGMGVNLRGLAFENVRVTTETVSDKPVLVIEGTIVDIARKPVEIPRLRFIVRDGRGAQIYAWNAVLEQPVLNPGEAVPFKTRLAAPPADGREIAVRFFHKLDLAAGGA